VAGPDDASPVLIGIDPILGPECLALLRPMGHGDEVVLADANFPAAATGRRLVRLDGVDVVRALDAVLSLLPVDDFEKDPLVGMRQVGEAAPAAPMIADMQRVVDRRTGGRFTIALIDRFAFYERARGAFGVIVTGEQRFYGNLILRKGVIRPDASGAGSAQ
jgi:L-fucose mutarotase